MIDNNWIIDHLGELDGLKEELTRVRETLKTLKQRKERLREQVQVLEGVKVTNGIAYREFDDSNISTADRKIHRSAHYYEHVVEKGTWYVVIYGSDLPNGGRWLSDSPQPNKESARNLAVKWVTGEAF